MTVDAPLDEADPGRSRSLKLKIKERIDDSERHIAALQQAMSQFGQKFDLSRFVEAFSSSDPIELNKVKAVERGSEQLYNYMAEIGAFGLELATLRTTTEEANARRDFDTLARAGVLNKTQRVRLQRLRELRRNLVHEYPGVAAKDAHEAAILAVSEYRRFIRSFADWMRAGFPGSAQKL